MTDHMKDLPFLNTPLIDRHITFYPGKMPFLMRLQFALAIIKGKPHRVLNLSLRVETE